jgi:hypothetical protein
MQGRGFFGETKSKPHGKVSNPFDQKSKNVILGSSFQNKYSFKQAGWG